MNDCITVDVIVDDHKLQLPRLGVQRAILLPRRSQLCYRGHHSAALRVLSGKTTDGAPTLSLRSDVSEVCPGRRGCTGNVPVTFMAA